MDVLLKSASSAFATPHALDPSSRGFSSVNWDRCDEDFEFVFGDGKVCRVHSVLAEFLSPKVGNMRKSDPCCTFYTFSSANSKNYHTFEAFVSNVSKGVLVEVNKTNYYALLQLFKELGNPDVSNFVWHWIHGELCEVQDKLLMLKLAVDLGGATWDVAKDTIDFVASRFYEIDKNILDELDFPIVEYLLSSPCLRIADEDSLYRFVKSRAERDTGFMTLFEYVWFEYLSVESVEDFVSFMGGHFHDLMNPNLWERIGRRLVLEAKLDTNSSRAVNSTPQNISSICGSSIQLDSSGGHLLHSQCDITHPDGILRYLAGYGGLANVVSVTGTGGIPTSAVDQRKGFYQSGIRLGPYLCCDFKQRRVTPTGYFLDSKTREKDGVEWMVFEGSNDGKQWVELDRRHFSLGMYVAKSFPCTTPCQKQFRYLRLRGIDERKAQLVIKAFEIYGNIYERDAYML